MSDNKTQSKLLHEAYQYAVFEKCMFKISAEKGRKLSKEHCKEMTAKFGQQANVSTVVRYINSDGYESEKQRLEGDGYTVAETITTAEQHEARNARNEAQSKTVEEILAAEKD